MFVCDLALLKFLQGLHLAILIVSASLPFGNLEIMLQGGELAKLSCGASLPFGNLDVLAQGYQVANLSVRLLFQRSGLVGNVLITVGFVMHSLHHILA